MFLNAKFYNKINNHFDIDVEMKRDSPFSRQIDYTPIPDPRKSPNLYMDDGNFCYPAILLFCSFTAISYYYYTFFFFEGASFL